MLPVGMVSGLTVGTGQPVGVFLSGKDRCFHAQLYTVAFSSLCRAKTSRALPSVVWRGLPSLSSSSLGSHVGITGRPGLTAKSLVHWLLQAVLPLLTFPEP